MKTKHLRMAILFSLVSTSAQLQCHPMTEYEQDGVCCRKCGPGTKMLTTGACLSPICRPCAEDEYQDSYTTASKCKQQPYCDPNKNFQPVQSKTRLISCQCQAGFKCSSELCVTCVLRRTCPPGHEAINTSDQLQDTVCEKCPAETFSSQSSWNNTCKRWTKCEHGEETPGTDTTDRICMSTPSEEPRSRVAIIIGVVIIPAIIGIAALAIWCWKKKVIICT
ncbi:tumor necrosis factor receptor superfamily member 5 [Synchiropus splendidus]|uniref:tumor necrosis factor receptor superfamily member 5 n=1 Tax=Synchiropus splendidus TaxID=270530 RepID=UPI00237E9540|nr:tumor necrosis factor receptor superfamily member 5 [Synchiropus splendidus]